MTENEEKLLLNDALCHWGVEAQMRMVQEECAELIVAVSKLVRNNMKVHANLIEEIADVKIMLAQLEVCFGFGRDVEMVRGEKLVRLQRRLEVDMTLEKE